MKPQPYRVRWEECTSDEPSPGWYWTDEDDERHGPYGDRDAAEEAIDDHEYELEKVR